MSGDPREAARGRVHEAGGVELLERLEHLDGLRRARPERAAAIPAPRAPDAGAHVDVDVAVAGGGLWLLLAPLLAARGLSVAVFDRARIGASHREWNASDGELAELVRLGLLDAETLDRLVVARYRHGTCRFHGGGSYPVAGVLDRAVDAGGLLAHARSLALRRGVALFDGHQVLAHAVGPDAVALRVHAEATGAAFDVVARVVVDARGAASPFATADLVCPTVGGVVEGLAGGDGRDEIDPEVGEILATVDPIEVGRQHVWEAFPGRPGETTVYLFYYARAREAVSLTELFGRFFATLPGYKRGPSRMLRPTFGLIPGWSRLSPPPRSGSGRIVLVGDAAARHSPLTYCGFGATLRSLELARDAVERIAHHGPDGGAPPAVHDTPLHALTGALAHVMASRDLAGDELNALLDTAFGVLHGMGPESYAALLRDELDRSTFVEFLGRTAGRHPAVWRSVVRGLGLGRAGRWGLSLARTMLSPAVP